MTTRREFIVGGSATAGFLISGSLVSGSFGTAFAASPKARAFTTAIARIEREVKGRLGVAVLDTHSGAQFAHRATERYPMCSTFKLLAASAVLKRVDKGIEKLDRRVKIEARDIVPDSTKLKAPPESGDMALGDLCELAMIYSDNTSGNLILASIGGPPALTAYARTLGDTVTRLDRNEPTLNESTPGDLRDTTSPAAMLGNIRKLVLGNALSGASKEQLTKWLLGNKTGDTRLRAKLPADWKVGDKTGSGDHGSTNDVGVIWPAQGAPIIVTIYLTETDAKPEQRNAALAAVGQAVAATISA